MLRRQPHVITAGIGLLADAGGRKAARSAGSTGHRRCPERKPIWSRCWPIPAEPAANAEAVRRMLAVRAQLVDVVRAGPALGLRPGEFLHAGPPIDWERASGPLRGALMGAAIFEGIADNARTRPTWRHGEISRSILVTITDAVGPMAGIVSPSMWLFVLEDAATGRRAYCSLNEGLGKVLRYGAYASRGDRAAALDVDGARAAAAGGGAAARAGGRDSDPRPRWCRWATRRTTATGPAR